MRVGFHICDVCEHVIQGPPVGLMAPMGTRNTSLQVEVCGECWEGIMNRIDSLSKLRHLLKLPAELFTDAGIWRITFDGSSHDPQVDDVVLARQLSEQMIEQIIYMREMMMRD